MLHAIAERATRASLDFVAGVRSAFLGAAWCVATAFRELANCGTLLTRGRLRPACASATTAVIRLGFQLPIDFTLMLLGRAISSAQTMLWLEAPGRVLTAIERATAERIFGDSITLSRVVIKEGKCGIGQVSGPRAFTHGDVIYMKSTPRHQWMRVLVHELVHVWQHQQVGTRYMSESLLAQSRGKGAYEWTPSAAAGVPWILLSREQQAATIEDAFAAGYFDDGECVIDGARWTGYVRVACEQLTFARRRTPPTRDEIA